MGLITVGLAEIKVGAAASNGVMPTGMTKIGKVYKDSCKILRGLLMDLSGVFIDFADFGHDQNRQSL